MLTYADVQLEVETARGGLRVLEQDDPICRDAWAASALAVLRLS
jgi:hypothetical protein